MFLHVPHDVLQIIAMGADNHMDMAAHNAPAINFQSFFCWQCFQLSGIMSLYSFLMKRSIQFTTAKLTK